jgi:Cd2+/Zn2+-exporting ATPase
MQNQHMLYRLEGLDCADCAAKFEKVLLSQPWVKVAKVNFAAGKLSISHSSSDEQLFRFIEAAGYRAFPDNRKISKEFFWWKNKKAIVTSVSGIFLLFGFLFAWLGMSKYIVIPLYIAVIVIGGAVFAKAGFYSLKALTLDMNILMSIAALGAVLIGEWQEGATVVFLFSLGNVLQGYAMDTTRNRIRGLMELSPEDALVVREGNEIRLALEQIGVGDIVIVRPGERIAVDGKVVEGLSGVNQASITGEAIPVTKQPGDTVYAGTLNLQSVLEIEVTKNIEDRTLSKIVRMVEEAQAQKAPVQQFIDRFARYYTPLVIAAAVGIAVLPWLVFAQPFIPWFKKALILLVISCPCALVISTPVTIVTAIGSAARNGVLIKGGTYLELAGKLEILAFDKTGTLTSGQMVVTDIIPAEGKTRKDVLELAAVIESRSQHPVAAAITELAHRESISLPGATGFEAFAGMGAGAIIDGKPYYIGNQLMFEKRGTNIGGLKDQVTALQVQGKTVMVVGGQNEIFGLVAVSDKVRENAAATLSMLRKEGIKKIVMLTGDNKETAGEVSGKLGIDEFQAGLLPEDKLKAINELTVKYGKVGMIGDGINDAPALAAATLGIAMGGVGSDTALETAGITLMNDDLSKLPYAIRLSRRALNIIKQNIAFALAVKAVFLVLTFMGLANLWMAVFADTGATLIVIANGMRLFFQNERFA